MSKPNKANGGLTPEMQELLQIAAHAHSLQEIRRWQVEVYCRDTRAAVFHKQIETLLEAGYLRRHGAEYELTRSANATLHPEALRPRARSSRTGVGAC